jgi:hypothetical protein
VVDDAPAAVKQSKDRPAQTDTPEFKRWFGDSKVVDDEGKPLWVDGGNRKLWGTYSEAEWVRVPDTKIAGTGVAKYGAIAGMYVRAPIWRDMVQLENQQIPHFWRSLLTMWKKNKTVYSIKTHVFNVLSNVGLADLADIRAREVFSAIRHIIDQDGTFNDAVRHGAFGTGEVERKINREMLQPLLKALMDEKIDETDPGWLFKMQVVIARFAEKVDDMASGAYQMEDSIFRMAMYVKMVRQGHEPRHAAHMARTQFLDYDIRAPWINALRYSVMPFISYTYRVIPLLAEAMINRPWKIYKWYMTMVLAQMVFASMAGDDDEDIEDIHELLPEDMQGTTFLATPRAVRLWFNDDAGNPVIYDMRNNIPGSNIFGLQGFTQTPWLPAIASPGGPAIIAAELVAFNASIVTGVEIVDTDGYTYSENLQRWAKHAYQAWMPDGAYVPFSRSYDKIMDAWDGRTNKVGEDMSLGQSVLSSVGVKISSVNLDIQFDRRMREFDRKIRAKRYRISDTQKVYAQQGADRGVMSTEEYLREMGQLERQIAQIERSRKEFLDSLSPNFRRRGE